MYKVPLLGKPLTPRMVDKPPFTSPVPGIATVEGETIPRRHPAAIPDFVSVPEEGCNTLYEVLIRSARKFSDSKAIGWRKFIKNHTEIQAVRNVVNGQEQSVSKEWSYAELGEYTYIGYREYVELAHMIGAAFRKLGMGQTEKILIYAGTRSVDIYTLVLVLIG